MDLNKNDLLRLLSYLEGELQARDITIAALKAEKAKQLLYQAKYGRFGLGDPFHAIQRDSDCQKDNSFDEAAVKAMYDNQLTQLENLIATQRKAQQRMREQLAAVEKRYHKVLSELADEKRKHAQDTAQGDDVTYMLEKERERLKQEVDFEKNSVKRLEKDLKKANTALEEERAASAKHKQVAVLLIKERKRLLQRLVELQQGPPSDGTTYTQNQIEAVLEKQQSEFDVEREKLKGRLSREEVKTQELLSEVERLRSQLETGVRPMRGASPHSGIPQPMGGKLYRSTPPNTPPEVRRAPVGAVHESPERDIGARVPGAGSDPSSVKRAIMQFNHSSPTRTPERTLTGGEGKLGEERVDASSTASSSPSPSSSSRLIPTQSGGTVTPAPAATVFSTPPSSGTTVFTTPTGTRISLNVGPTATNLPRKGGPFVRGTPPPVPPNKPQYVPQHQSATSTATTTTSSTTTPRKDVGTVRTVNPRIDSASKPQPPTKFGITISKDKITISSPESPNDSMRPLIGSASTASGGVAGGAGGRLVGSGEGTVIRKPSQIHVVYPTSERVIHIRPFKGDFQ